MGKIRRGGYVFIKRVSDHGNHVHIIADNGTTMKWDMDEEKSLAGRVPRRVRAILRELKRENKL